MAELVMPRLSDTMEEGTILRWLIADGATVRRGQELVEIETDKATMIYESDLDGLLAIVAAEGDTLPVGAVIARVGETEATGAPDAPDAGGTRAEAPAPSAGEPGAAPSAPRAEPAREAVPTPAGATSDIAREGERVKASPLARRLARGSDVDLRALTGTGPGGRIVKADVQAAASAGPATPRAETVGAGKPSSAAIPAPSPAAAPPPAAGLAGVATAKGETTEIELSRTQQTIARRMAESKATIPHFVLQADVDMQECVALRTELKKLAPHLDAPPSAGPPAAAGTGEATPTYNDMVVKACALALREHPRANSSYRDGRLQLHSRVNVGVAVAVDSDEPAGGALIVPTVFDADLKSLGEIARETRALAARVRDGSITPPELGGGTFTVSNLGMFGVTSFTAIINPPQAAILSVGSLGPRAVAGEDGQIIARHEMTVTLACDHRILYGADAARFLARIRELLERPASLTL
ncbi:MAG TPA: dihydrolipoamide acetyltransferase family protein [Solirubrobacteraceae bacterium]|nr:dihydrolipoamide acetyltransferase family protein [Solirubrobacteraceae bacterium]